MWGSVGGYIACMGIVQYSMWRSVQYSMCGDLLEDIACMGICLI